MNRIRVDDLEGDDNPLHGQAGIEIKGGATLDKTSNEKSAGSTLKTNIKGYGSTTGEGPSTF